MTQKAIWFIESHHRTPLTLAEIATNCGVSPFHLTRTFAATTGLSLMRYTRGRRLSEAARLVASGAPDILSLALEWGYGSHEAFTRAFREQFGLTPAELRVAGDLTKISLLEALSMSRKTAVRLEAPRFENIPLRVFAGLQERYDCESPVGIPDQWQKFGPFIGTLRGQVGEAAYGVCHNFDEDGNFDYMTAVEIAKNSSLPREFTTLKVPAQRYVVFRHREHVAGIRATIAAIWSDWFPSSGATAAEAPMLERYGREFNARTGEGGLEIWIAIE